MYGKKLFANFGYNRVLRLGVVFAMNYMAEREKTPEILSRLKEKKGKMIEKETEKPILESLNSIKFDKL